MRMGDSGGGIPEDQQTGLQELLEPFDWAGWTSTPRDSAWYLLKAEMVGRAKLSKSTKRAIARILKKELKVKKEHYKTRRKKERDRYRKYKRLGRAARYQRQRVDPEWMWKNYKLEKAKSGISWDITLEEWMDCMNRDIVRDLLGSIRVTKLHNCIFNVIRLDKSNKSCNINNIVFIDRYTKSILYKPVV